MLGPAGTTIDRSATRAQNTVKLPQRAAVVGHVLKQVGRDDGVQASVGDRQIAGVGSNQLRRRNQPVGLLQTRADQIDPHQGRGGVTSPHILQQEARRAANVRDRGVGGQRTHAGQDRAAGPTIQEVGPRGLLMQALELI